MSDRTSEMAFRHKSKFCTIIVQRHDTKPPVPGNTLSSQLRSDIQERRRLTSAKLQTNCAIEIVLYIISRHDKNTTSICIRLMDTKDTIFRPKKSTAQAIFIARKLLDLAERQFKPVTHFIRLGESFRQS